MGPGPEWTMVTRRGARMAENLKAARQTEATVQFLQLHHARFEHPLQIALEIAQAQGHFQGQSVKQIEDQIKVYNDKPVGDGDVGQTEEEDGEEEESEEEESEEEKVTSATPQVVVRKQAGEALEQRQDDSRIEEDYDFGDDEFGDEEDEQDQEEESLEQEAQEGEPDLFAEGAITAEEAQSAVVQLSLFEQVKLLRERRDEFRIENNYEFPAEEQARAREEELRVIAQRAEAQFQVRLNAPAGEQRQFLTRSDDQGYESDTSRGNRYRASHTASQSISSQSEDYSGTSVKGEEHDANEQGENEYLRLANARDLARYEQLSAESRFYEAIYDRDQAEEHIEPSIETEKPIEAEYENEASCDRGQFEESFESFINTGNEDEVSCDQGPADEDIELSIESGSENEASCDQDQAEEHTESSIDSGTEASYQDAKELFEGALQFGNENEASYDQDQAEEYTESSIESRIEAICDQDQAEEHTESSIDSRMEASYQDAKELFKGAFEFGNENEASYDQDQDQAENHNDHFIEFRDDIDEFLDDDEVSDQRKAEAIFRQVYESFNPKARREADYFQLQIERHADAKASSQSALKEARAPISDKEIRKRANDEAKIHPWESEDLRWWFNKHNIEWPGSNIKICDDYYRLYFNTRELCPPSWSPLHDTYILTHLVWPLNHKPWSAEEIQKGLAEGIMMGEAAATMRINVSADWVSWRILNLSLVNIKLRTPHQEEDFWKDEADRRGPN